MIWAAIVVGIIDRKWLQAAAWCGLGAVLSSLGLMHANELTGRDSIISLPLLDWISGNGDAKHPLFPAGSLALAYVGAAMIFLLARFVTLPDRTTISCDTIAALTGPQSAKIRQWI